VSTLCYLQFVSNQDIVSCDKQEEGVSHVSEAGCVELPHRS
jgi:hypothetical protein